LHTMVSLSNLFSAKSRINLRRMYTHTCKKLAGRKDRDKVPLAFEKANKKLVKINNYTLIL